jgi:hypothetical protein
MHCAHSMHCAYSLHCAHSMHCTYSRLQAVLDNRLKGAGAVHTGTPLVTPYTIPLVTPYTIPGPARHTVISVVFYPLYYRRIALSTHRAPSAAGIRIALGGALEAARRPATKELLAAGVRRGAAYDGGLGRSQEAGGHSGVAAGTVY